LQEIFPETHEQVAEIVKSASAGARPLAIEGRGSKRGWGRPVVSDTRLSLSRLKGIISYEPDELVLTAFAGTPIADIETALSERQQHLAFEPARLGHLWNSSGGAGTLGGVLACNLSGPRRPSAGAARDHFLGFRAVNGAGQEFKAGGKVVKNVTGYDVSKLMAGSFGTLAVMTEVTVKVLPAPQKQRTGLFGFEDLSSAHHFLIKAQQGEHGIDGAAIVPAPSLDRIRISRTSGLGPFVVACRMSGTGVSVEARWSALKKTVSVASEELHTANSMEFWMALRDAGIFALGSDWQIWRLTVPPSEGADHLKRMLEICGKAEWFMDWGGGLIWLALPEEAGIAAAEIRRQIPPGQGDAILLRASLDFRAANDPIMISPDVKALALRVKQAFDPQGILNPGRLHRDW